MAARKSPLSSAHPERRAWLEPILALLVFLLPLLNNLPFGDLNGWVTALFAVLVIGVLAAGLALGLPRWSMPAVGILLFLLTFSGFAVTAGQWDGNPIAPWSESRALDARVAYALVMDGLLWLSYLLVTVLVVVTARMVAYRAAGKAPDWWRRLRERDWSMLSFLFYGANIAFLLLTLSDYAYAGPLALVVVIVLVAGMLLYLRAALPGPRILILVCATLLAGIILAAGKWALIPMQAWDAWFAAHPPETERWIAAVSTLHNSLYLSALLALPSFLPLKKKKAGGVQTV